MIIMEAVTPQMSGNPLDQQFQKVVRNLKEQDYVLRIKMILAQAKADGFHPDSILSDVSSILAEF